MLDSRVASFAKIKFNEYYRKAYIPISELSRREFGFGDFESKIVKRHISFRTFNEFKSYILSDTPAFISVSTSIYRYPSARPMEKKERIKSELVFDIDSTDLNLKCQLKHGRSWVCSNCLDATKDEVFKLVEDFLVPDFGVPDDKITINFSGNRGYHVHVIDEEFMNLNADARKRVSDYITGKGITLSRFFPNIDDPKKQLRGPKPDDAGWGGRIARGMISALNSGEERLVSLGIEKPLARKLLRSKADVIMGITTGNWDKVNLPKKAEVWNSILKAMSISQTTFIDKNVTSVMDHLLRVPNTIHGDTGLISKSVENIKALGKFDPMKEAVLFRGGTVAVHVNESPVLEIGGSSFGPYKDKDVELPTYAALYLMLKRAAVFR